MKQRHRIKRQAPRAPRAVVTAHALIMEGEALSTVIDCTAGPVQLIVMPDGWDPANMTFQVSADGDTFADWFDRGGNEMTVACVAGTAFVPEFDATKAIRIRIRSGTRDNPIRQSAIRAFTIVLDA